MRTLLLIGIAVLPLTLAGCFSRTVEERPVQIAPAQAPTTTIIVPPGSTVVCTSGQTC